MGIKLKAFKTSAVIVARAYQDMANNKQRRNAQGVIGGGALQNVSAKTVIQGSIPMIRAIHAGAYGLITVE